MILETLENLLFTFAPLLTVLAVAVSIVWGAYWLLLRRGLGLGADRRLPRQLVMLGLSAVAIVAVVLALPVPYETRNQLLTVLGLLVSAIITLSSTTLVANAMAGLMLRSTKSFRTGDFITVEAQFGRVTERGLLHTEIQTEDGELTSLPNAYLISNPVTVVRTSGTLVSASLSLGYDVHHARIEPLLIEAAKRAELEKPFVRVLDLGNFAVTYRVSGFLGDIKNLLTVRSKLRKMVLDALHGDGIEIVSPTFMNQRPTPREEPYIPAPLLEDAPKEEERAPEDIMFNKAERAERIEFHRKRILSEIQELKEQAGATKGEENAAIDEKIEQRKKQLEALQNADDDTEEKPKPKKNGNA